MRYLIFFMVCLLSAPAFAGPLRTVVTPVDMFVGESKVFEESNVMRVAIGSGDIISVKELDPERLLIMADKAGSTTVHVWYNDKEWAPRVYNIRISELDPVTRVRQEQMVRFNVRLVEFRKSALKNLGIDWSKTIDGPSAAFAASAVDSNLLRAPGMSQFSGLPNRLNGVQGSLGWASTITSRINFLASNGHASTIAEPILMCLNGGEADFHAGGELPLPIRDEDGKMTVEYKPYGIRLSVKPKVSDAGIIDTIISTEVSEIDNSVSVENIPGLITRNTTTRVQVVHGETIVLAGLLSERLSSDNSSVPGLGKIPGLGKAFGNEQARQQTTELVMFLQPQIVSSDESPQAQTGASNAVQVSQWETKLKTNMVH